MHLRLVAGELRKVILMMMADSRPKEMKVEIGEELPLGDYEPEPSTEIPVFVSFMQVGAAIAGPSSSRHAEALGWARLERRGAAVWALFTWGDASLEWFFRQQPDVDLELAYAATVRSRTGDPPPADHQLDRILFLVIRPRAGRRPL